MTIQTAIIKRKAYNDCHDVIIEFQDELDKWLFSVRVRQVKEDK